MLVIEITTICLIIVIILSCTKIILENCIKSWRWIRGTRNIGTPSDVERADKPELSGTEAVRGPVEPPPAAPVNVQPELAGSGLAIPETAHTSVAQSSAIQSSATELSATQPSTAQTMLSQGNSPQSVIAPARTSNSMVRPSQGPATPALQQPSSMVTRTVHSEIIPPLNVSVTVGRQTFVCSNPTVPPYFFLIKFQLLIMHCM
jgi:hypothetical protein